ncbi:MAG: hypothetical protein Fur0010_17960 [Bdellovibrio sp.]
MNNDEDFYDLSDKFCERPFTYMEILVNDKNSELFESFACCYDILPVAVGSVNDSSIEQIWNSEKYQAIRKSIHDGTYEYCKIAGCPKIQNNELHSKKNPPQEFKEIIKLKKTVIEKGPKILNLGYDHSCNLACPSCRTDFITKPLSKNIEVAHQKVEDYLKKNKTKVLVCSSGDPFQSRYFTNLLKDFNDRSHPNIDLHIVTNGVLLTPKLWDSYYNLHQKINHLSVSIDAATEPTYNKIRVGGNFSQVLTNVRHIVENNKNPNLFIQLDFVVQENNFFEMADFVRLGKELKVQKVFFQRISNWGTFSSSEFEKKAIYHKNHPLHPQFLEHLKDDIFNDPIVNLGNLSSYKTNKVKRSTPKPKFNLKNAILHTIDNRIIEIKGLWQSLTK